MGLVVAVVFVVLAARLVQVQIASGHRYSAIATSEITSTQPVQALRGGIYDRNGAALAISVPTSDVIADPFLISDPGSVAAKLAPYLGQSPASLVPLLSEHTGWVVVARQVADATATKVAHLGLNGISLQSDAQRVNPAGQLATPLLGTVHANGSGAGGLEGQYDKLLAGTPGTSTQQVSPAGVPLPGTSTHRSGGQPGTGLELTLDEPLQYVTEQSLAAEITSSKAKSGIAVVMDTHTGDILAMANLVADPKTGAVVEAPSNLALTQVYEPGSVFKLVTFSAALQRGIITPQEVFTVPNSLLIDGSVFHDAETHPTEELTATDILAQSSNIGTIEIAQRLGAQALSQQITALGFGKTTGLDFPGESPGLVLNPDKWEPTDLASTPIGQDDAVTAQQVLDMVNTVATGGEFVAPRLVRATVAPDGAVTATKPSATHRVLSSQVSAQLTTMMESVVQDGTAVAAAVPGYTVAGKTGTAQIPDPTHLGYIPGAYMATFAGFAPAEHPVLSAIVVLQQPTPIYGGTVAAPVFAQIMRYALHRYGVPTSPAGDQGQSATVDNVPFPTTASASSAGSTASPGTIATAGNATGQP